MLACPTEGTPRYRPRSASNALKDIVEDSLEELLSSWEQRFAKDHGPLHPRVKKLFESFTRCGDLRRGANRVLAPVAGHHHAAVSQLLRNTFK